MPTAPLVVRLDRADLLSGAPCPLRATVTVVTDPMLGDASLLTHLQAALEAAVGLGQSRYGLYRDEMPSRRGAVEEAARAALETSLARGGHRLLVFAVEALERDEPPFV